MSRTLLAIATGALSLLLAPGTQAQGWPAKPLKIIVPNGAGSAPACRASRAPG